MEIIESLLFSINISLLLLHEMDAIKCKEWNMFIILKDMKESKAYLIFSVLHLPLYFALIYLLSNGSVNTKNIIGLCINFFLLFHWVIHFAFRNKHQNNFRNLYSSILINLMGVFSLAYIVLMFFSN